MIGGVNYVTVASDASCNRVRTGYAYYIRDDDGATQQAWYVEENHGSTGAEITAMIEALVELRARNYPKNTKIIYYCDNMMVINMINAEEIKFTEHFKKQYAYELALLDHLRSEVESIEARHVPAHTGKEDLKRYYLNRWCDFNARSMARHMRLHQVRRKHGRKKHQAVRALME